MIRTIRLFAGRNSAGDPVFEELLAEPMPADRYRLVKSPGLVLGLAADDEFEISGGGSFEVLRRGGNVCLQVFAAEEGDVAGLCHSLEEKFESLAGRIDGCEKRLVVVTVSVDNGFPLIEKIVGEVVGEVPGREWYFGNVYDPADGVTPLNWWT